MSDVRDPITRSFRTGDWFGIFGANATVILPPSEKARVGALWEMVDDGAGFDETLDALIATGLRDLPGFVLVSESDGETKVVLRGAAHASFTAGGEEVELDGSAATTWVERSLRGVTRMSVSVADEVVEGDDLCLAGGLVRLSRVDQPPRAAAPVPAPPVEQPPSEEPAAEPVAEPVVLAPVPDEIPLEEPVHEEPGHEEPVHEEPEVDEEATQAVPFLAGVFGDPEPAEPVEEANDDAPTGEPIAWAPPPSAPPSAPSFGPPTTPPPVTPPPVTPPPVTPPPVTPPSTPPPPVPPADEVDHDGMTRAGGWDPGQFARQQPGIPGQPQAPSVTSRPVARLVFSSGETVEVDRAVLVGRAPEARRFTSTEQPRLVTVPSPNQEISSTHLEIRPGSGADHGSAVVTDMGSTNGTVLVQPGLPPEDLQPGIAVQLIPGAVVDLGDGVTIQVTNP
ncbi:FHA domain-containing protein [Nocardioides sp. MAHUQ-72]|uniref:FHA domain-containing protein n=1 Tax=unclassified Nocardioides TaxID=2615069 RepID=UPI003620250E